MVEKAEWAADSTEEREEGHRAGLERCSLVSTLSASRNVLRLTIEHYLVVVCRPLNSYKRYHSPNNAAKQSKSTADCKSYLIP